MKRALLDQLAAGHDFEVPGAMVEAEFAQIWQQLESRRPKKEPDPAAAHAPKSKPKKTIIARLRYAGYGWGYCCRRSARPTASISRSRKWACLSQQAAQQYRPEDRQRFAEYIANDAMAAAQLRAPMYEEKVVDFLFDKAEVTDARSDQATNLQAAIEADDGMTGSACRRAMCMARIAITGTTMIMGMIMSRRRTMILPTQTP